MIVKIVMCEGPHDTAFVSRILRVMGCGNDKTQIGKFPDYLSNFLKKQYTPDVDTYPIYDARGKTITPNYGLNYKDEVLFLLYSMGGDSKKNNRNKMVSYFLNLFKTEMLNPAEMGFDLHFVYEFDADKAGRDKRLEMLNKEICEQMPDFPGVSHGNYCNHANISWGAYIFSDPDRDDGKLEDMVLPMMRKNNKDVFADIELVVNKREAYKLYQTHKKKMDDDRWEKDKAMIGMAGQLNKCGSANAAIIEQSCLITDEQIVTNMSCLEIGSFLLKGSSYNSVEDILSV